MGGRARVDIQEVDLSTRVPSFPGVYGGIIIPARKGEVGVPKLVSFESDLLGWYTPKGEIEVSDDLSFYSASAFLVKSNKLWVVRVANKPLYGGIYLSQDSPVVGLNVDLEADTFSIFTVQHGSDVLYYADQFYNALDTGEIVRLTATAIPTGFAVDTDYYVIKLSEYRFMLADSYTNAMAGVNLEGTDVGTAVVTSLYTNAGAASENKAVEYGISFPENYVYDTTSGKELETTSEFTVDVDLDVFNVTTKFINMGVTGDIINLAASTFPTVLTGAALDGVTDYYLIVLDEEVQIARTLADATAGTAINLTSNGVDVVGTYKSKLDTGAVTAVNASDTFTTIANFYAALVTGDTVRMTYTTVPTVDEGDAFDNVTDYYLIKSTINTVKLARTLADANAGRAIGFSTDGVDIVFTLQTKEDDCTFITDLKTNELTIDEDLYHVIRTGDSVQVSTNHTLPNYEYDSTIYQLSDSVTYYAIRSKTDNRAKLALSYSEALLGIEIDILNDGVGTQYIKLTEGNAQLAGAARKCVLITGRNEGEWNNDIYIETLHYPYEQEANWTEADRDAANAVQVPGCFLIYVYQKEEDDTYTLLEEYLVSRDNSIRVDGVTVYINTVLDQSNYILGFNNEEVDSSVQPVNQTTKLQLENGDDGFAVTDADMLYQMAPGTSPFDSRRDILVTLLMDGGYAVPSYQKQGIIALCEKRKDCFGILSCPLSYELSNDALSSVSDYRSLELNANTSYAALYSSHLLIQDKYNDRKIYVSPDGYVGAIISFTAANQEIWYAPAGPRRGVLQVLDVAQRWNEGQQDHLTNLGVNPIDFYPARGIRVWGNRTLLSRPSSLRNVNVRLMLIVIEPAIAEFLEDFLFEFNDPITRILVTSGINSYMADIQARRGVYEFKVVCSEENNKPENIDRNELIVWLYVKPMLAIEYIRFKTIITRTGSTFSYTV